MTTMPAPPIIRERGREEYTASFDAMRAFTDARGTDTPDEIWLVEHPPVYTLGLAGDPAHLLVMDSGIPMVRIDRGGQITYHGPGQVVAYLLIDLRRRKLFVRTLVEAIEEAVILTLAAYNLPVERKTGAPGIYLSRDIAPQALKGAKIAALGLKIRNGCSYHGVSLNVDMDLEPFDWINPCGYAGLQTVDMKRAGIPADWRDVAGRLAAQLAQQLAARGGTRADAGAEPANPELADIQGCATRATERQPAQP